ncbi:phospholipase domain-containing protein, partial [Acidithiobacillus sp. IBUN Pt1247-S3]|uniref:phospholipase domain-containing protein n=1 Tax=Acidithiobacillus sp. IBUN Pt1247-S3 TaxID=3166642 RepID=UPI0034E5AC9C
ATVHHESTLAAPVVPEEQPVAIHPQEAGLRRRRPLAYATRLRLRAQAEGVELHIHNPAPVGVVCTAYWEGSHALPHHYTVGAGAQLSDTLRSPNGQDLALMVYGPDGFIRGLYGKGASPLQV